MLSLSRPGIESSLMVANTGLDQCVEKIVQVSTKPNPHSSKSVAVTLTEYLISSMAKILDGEECIKV